MQTNATTFDLALAEPAWSIDPALEMLGKFLGLFLEHAFNGAAPPWHVATIGQVMQSQTPAE